jgi:hypothetical protein
MYQLSTYSVKKIITLVFKNLSFQIFSLIYLSLTLLT